MLPVSRFCEMEERLLVAESGLLVAESELTRCNVLVWGAAAGITGLVIMAGALVWVRARSVGKGEIYLTHHQQ